MMSHTIQPSRLADGPALLREEAGHLPLEELGQIADHHAGRLWGEAIGRGQPFQVFFEEQERLAYVFPYHIGEKYFPEYETLLEQIAGLTETYAVEAREGEPFEAFISRSLGSFGSVYVSPTLGQVPVLRADHYLHPFFAEGQRLLEEARRKLGAADVRLEQILAGPDSCAIFEFGAGDRRLRLHGRTMKEAPPKKRQPSQRAAAGPEPAALRCAGECWDALHLALDIDLEAMPAGVRGLGAAQVQAVAAAILPKVEKRLIHADLVPPLVWTLNCATTAKAMVLAYWDRYVRGLGGHLGYGRLVDYWYDHPSNGENVPNLLDEVHAANKIDVWKVNNYSCDWKEYQAGPANDWAWETYKAEIDQDRPAAWSIAGHTMAGIGYRMENYGRWAIVYDTWSRKPTEFAYTECVGVAHIVPQNGTKNEHAALIAPQGGEVVAECAPQQLSFFVWGSKINHIDLSYSETGGRQWAPLVKNLPARPGLNEYRWMPPRQGAHNRARLEAFAGNEYIAGDGSYENFTVAPEAPTGEWINLYGPARAVLAGYDKFRNHEVIYVVDAASGDIYQFAGKPTVYWNWIKVGGPGRQFVLDGQGRLFGIAPDGSGVFLYTGTAMEWKAVGGPAGALYPAAEGVLATNPTTGDLYRYLGNPHAWQRIGGPGKSFAGDAEGRIYGISPDGSGVYCHDPLRQKPGEWTRVGGPAGALCARGHGVYATNPQTGDIYFYHGAPFLWDRIGGPGRMFTVDTKGRLYGLAPDGGSVWRYNGHPQAPLSWERIGGPALEIFGGWKTVLAMNPETKGVWILTE